MDWLKHIIFGAGMLIMYFVMRTHGKGSLSSSSENAENYIIKTPVLLKLVYSVIFAIGMILYIIFLICYIMQLGNVTKGHLWVAFIFSLFGLVIVIISSKWKIEVSRERICIERVLKRAVTMQISDIDKVKIGSKGEIHLYFQEKKLTTVDPLCINYEKLCDTLTKYKKL